MYLLRIFLDVNEFYRLINKNDENSCTRLPILRSHRADESIEEAK